MIINSPSDFKIRVNHIYDIHGNPIDISTVNIFFKIKDNYGNTYEARYFCSDPSKNFNTYIQGDEGEEVLYVLVENYSLRGRLTWQIGTVVPDIMFPDGDWKTFNKYKDLGIDII